MNRIAMWLVRRLLPKCDVCKKNKAYFEHFPKVMDVYNCKICEEHKIDGWIYVCWECSFEHEGHGSVWV